MGEWVIGAFINVFGSIAINFGTNLLKLGHDEDSNQCVFEEQIPIAYPAQYITTLSGSSFPPRSFFVTLPSLLYPMLGAPFLLLSVPAERKAMCTRYQWNCWKTYNILPELESWYGSIGILFFAFGNCLNFISFGYAAQSLLAALGSIQFVSNIAFAYFVLNKTVTVKVLIATAFIVLGNIFLVAFGNHQSPVYTPEQLAEKYSNMTFLLYCLILVLVVALHHSAYRRGELLLAVPGQDLKSYWQMLLPFSYAIVSGAVGSCSVLFAKSLSNLLRLSLSSGYPLHSWFTYSMLLLFLSTAGFWMARLNEGLSLFDAILIVPMFQIAWTFFSICTGFVYFQEYQVFDALRTTMFVIGVISVFIGISLLAPDDSKGGEAKDTSLVAVTSSLSTDVDRLVIPSEDSQIKDTSSFILAMKLKAANVIVKAKAACSLSLGLGEDSIHASSVFVMPMVSSKITGFRGSDLGRTKLFSPRGSGWSKISVDEDAENILETTSMLPQSINVG